MALQNNSFESIKDTPSIKQEQNNFTSYYPTPLPHPFNPIPSLTDSFIQPQKQHDNFIYQTHLTEYWPTKDLVHGLGISSQDLSLPQPETQSLESLLNSETASQCIQLLEEPVRRKPGRKPKFNTEEPVESASSQLDRKEKNRIAADESRKRYKERAEQLEFFTDRLRRENETLKRYL